MWRSPFSDEENPFPKMEMSRMESSSTRKTNATEESFQKFMQQEAKYWEEEVKDSTRGRPSLEERASRLRALSRSRSRSDGSVSNHDSLFFSSVRDANRLHVVIVKQIQLLALIEWAPSRHRPRLFL